MKQLLLAMLALAVAPSVYAQAESAYYGVALASFDYEERDGLGGALFSDNTSAYRLMVGYQFMEHLTVEGAYGRTRTIRDTATFPLVGGGTVDVAFRAEFKSLTIRLLGVLPFDSGVALLGGLGFADLKQDFAISIGGGPEQSGEVSGNEPTYFIGAQYNWDRVAVRLAFEKFDFESGVDVAETSVSFFYRL